MIIVYLFLGLLHVFVIMKIIDFGLDFSLDTNRKWYGGFPLGVVWTIGWIAGPPLIFSYYCRG